MKPIETSSVPRPTVRTGFTLMELLVVIGVIALIAAVAVPSITQVFKAGADGQAYHLMAAQLSAARSVAIQEGTYAGVHVQMGAWNNPNVARRRDLRGICYSAVVRYHSTKFSGTPGYPPQRIPGTIAFGELSPTFIQGSGNFTGVGGTLSSAGSGINDFTSFTVVFSASGAAVRQIRTLSTGRVSFNTGDDLFKADTRQLWDSSIANTASGGELPLTALCLFDSSELTDPDVDENYRHNYLNENAQFLPVNVHTGQLFPRR